MTTAHSASFGSESGNGGNLRIRPDSAGDPAGNAPAPAGIVGEVIEASATRFIAQCPADRLHAPPDLGTFVKICPSPPRAASAPAPPDDPFADAPTPAPLKADDETIYALVCEASTGSREPGRRAAAYGLSEADLRAQQPQIFALLATEFAALHVGHAQDGRLRPYLPPRPPRLHAFVYACDDAEICALAEAPDLLRTLLGASGEVSADELVAACLRHAYQCRNQDFAFLVRAGKQLAGLLRDDPERLSALLRKIQP